ncbi:MAG: GTPase Der [Mycoplasmataceae bacterium]|nr:MAG: GTPase Der [Mycoplasmataceae bacterium]
MTNAQKWLDKEYPLENRIGVVELDISEKNLSGSLHFSGFINLEKIDCRGNKISDLNLSDCFKLNELNCSSQKTSQLSRLDLSSCPNLIKLDCSSNKISELDLSNCPNLVEIVCNYNQLDSLKITKLPHLKVFNCWNNKITELNWQAFNPEKLTFLSVSNNNFSKQDLSCFSKFINLEGLWVGTDVKDRIEKRFYNRFFGSLKPLQNLTKLKKLQIENTDIDSGLEFLPESLEKIICWSPPHHENFLVNNLEEALINYKEEGDEEYYDIVKWRNNGLLLEKNPLVINLKKQVAELLKKMENFGAKDYDVINENLAKPQKEKGELNNELLKEKEKNKQLIQELEKVKNIMIRQSWDIKDLAWFLSEGDEKIRIKIEEIHSNFGDLISFRGGKEWLREELGNIQEQLGKRFSLSKDKEVLNKKKDLIEKEMRNIGLFEEEAEQLQGKLSEVKKESGNFISNSVAKLNSLAEWLEKIEGDNINVRNILLIGRTGSGKSTLANVLTETNNFKESSGSVSETREIQTGEFDHLGIKYRIIDTIGIGDTKLSEREVLRKISQITYLLRNGLHQVLFVTGGRLNREEATVYELLKETVFDERITDYTAIVRTRFPEFQNKDNCKQDIKSIGRENTEFSDIIKNLAEFIHVDNSSFESRKLSRDILLDHLMKCQNAYKPNNLQGLVKEIRGSMWEIEELQKEKNIRERQIRRIKEKIVNKEENDNGGELIDIMRKMIEKQSKTEDNMVRLAEIVADKTSQYIERKVEEKGLLTRWIEIIEDTTSEMKSLFEIAAKCQVM